MKIIMCFFHLFFCCFFIVNDCFCSVYCICICFPCTWCVLFFVSVSRYTVIIQFLKTVFVYSIRIYRCVRFFKLSNQCQVILRCYFVRSFLAHFISENVIPANEFVSFICFCSKCNFLAFVNLLF